MFAVTLGWVVVAVPFLIFDGTPFRVLVTDQDGQPVSGVAVTTGVDQFYTNVAGVVQLEWRRQPIELSVASPGFVSTTLSVIAKPETDLTAEISERVLVGVVTTGGEQPLSGALVDFSGEVAVTGEDGGFTFRRVEPGRITANRPAWTTAEAEWDGSDSPVKLSIDPLIIRAIHITGPAAADSGLWQGFLDLAEATAVNGLMIDLKDETGKVYYETTVPLAAEVGAVGAGYDLPALLADAQSAGLYVIGRVVAFQDPKVPKSRPELSVWDSATGAPYENHDQFFLDPTDPEVRDYAFSIAEEACRLGVDEVQFDYVRFPDGFPESARFDGGSTEAIRIATISGFLSEAGDRLRPLGCAVAADVFGFTASVPNDGGIGQRWEEVTAAVDVVSPMLYPSHYYPGWFEFQTPNDHPGPVVSRALDDGLSRMSSSVVIRPWLQDFWYTADQVRAQIIEAEERGLGWMLWNAGSRFSTEALGPPE